MDFVFRRTYRGQLRAIILDWAGTTLDHGCMAPTVVFMEVFKRKGIPITMEQARAPMGAHKRDHIAAIAAMDKVSKMWREEYGRPCDEKDIDDMFQDFIPRQIACLPDYADLIPGTLDAVKDFRSRRMRIGSTTGYTEEMMQVLMAEAERRGYVPDSTVCATQVPAGRPHPWMCLQNAFNLQLYPMEAFVKVGDTLPDIAEGLNAGMWTVGLAMTGNEMGLTEEQLHILEPDVRAAKSARARERMHQAGAHYVVDSIENVPDIIDDINARLTGGEKP